MDTILIVDDDPAIRFLVKEFLNQVPYRCLTACNGLEAQALIESKQMQISAVVLDWKMPKMSGIDLLKWIKRQAQFRDLPVIMQTALAGTENIKEGIDAGAFYYLTKPIHAEVLKSIVRAAVSDYHHTQTLLNKIKESENPFRLMVEGTFRFQTLSDCEYLALRIANATPFPEKVIVIMELFVNAVEHGNLNITYTGKTKFLQEGTLETEIERRLTLPEYRDNYVEVTVNRSPDQMTVLIKDQGAGFDFEKYLELDESRVFNIHGRGIAIANSYLSLEYLDRGNQVLVRIPFE